MRSQVKTKKHAAILGYGSQGRAIALNLRDSGYDLVIGLPVHSRSRAKARRERFWAVVDIRDAVTQSDLIIMAFPDHLHGRVFARQIAPFLRSKSTLVFLHGMSVHFGFVKPPKDCDIVLLAPHAPGLAVREKFLARDRSISAFMAVHQNPSRHAGQTLASLARALGFNTGRLIKTTFADEAVGDIFGEQAVLCGGMAMLLKNGFETLVERGLKPEHAYLEVAYQLDLIVSLVKRFGIEGMLKRISVAARYGSVTAGPRVIDASVKKRMRGILDDIISGRFPRRLNALGERAIRELDKSVGRLSHPMFERAARKFAK